MAIRLKSFSSGWKTYAITVAGLGLGVADYYGYHIPHWAEIILGFAGLGTARMAIQKQTSTTVSDVVTLVGEILSQVSVPDTTVTVEGATASKAASTVTVSSVSAPVVGVGVSQEIQKKPDTNQGTEPVADTHFKPVHNPLQGNLNFGPLGDK